MSVLQRKKGGRDEYHTCILVIARRLHIFIQKTRGCLCYYVSARAVINTMKRLNFQPKVHPLNKSTYKKFYLKLKSRPEQPRNISSNRYLTKKECLVTKLRISCEIFYLPDRLLQKKNWDRLDKTISNNTYLAAYMHSKHFHKTYSFSQFILPILGVFEQEGICVRRISKVFEVSYNH